ncbi:MAG: acetolactate synthase small subunit [Treponemataceae bacterium]|nr:acetolactate synthase small subunit [Treponemataceae bacterium]
MNRYTMAILVRNQSGVLNRITSVFRRKQFNIVCLTVSETESSELSRITVVIDGEEKARDQMIGMMGKMPDVIKVFEIDNEDCVSRELALIKVKNDKAIRNDVMNAISAYNGKIVDYTNESMIIQLTDKRRRIDSFVQLAHDFEILEICRTGVVTLERGEKTIKTDENTESIF